jgi:hypothetical protein
VSSALLGGVESGWVMANLASLPVMAVPESSPVDLVGQ